MEGRMGDGGDGSTRSGLEGGTGTLGATVERFRGGGRGRGLKEFRLVAFDSAVGGPVEGRLLMGGVDRVLDEAGGRLKSAAVLGASL